MDIGFVWDETKHKTVVRKHHIKLYEVVAVFDDPIGYEMPEQTEHEVAGCRLAEHRGIVL